LAMLLPVVCRPDWEADNPDMPMLIKLAMFPYP
jgi:hypothetical protein